MTTVVRFSLSRSGVKNDKKIRKKGLSGEKKKRRGNTVL
jgi:hypothetical protein